MIAPLLAAALAQPAPLADPPAQLTPQPLPVCSTLYPCEPVLSCDTGMCPSFPAFGTTSSEPIPVPNYPVTFIDSQSVLTDAEGVIVMSLPPCGTPEAVKSKRCLRWKVDPSNPRALRAPLNAKSPPA